MLYFKSSLVPHPKGKIVYKDVKYSLIFGNIIDNDPS